MCSNYCALSIDVMANQCAWFHRNWQLAWMDTIYSLCSFESIAEVPNLWVVTWKWVANPVWSQWVAGCIKDPLNLTLYVHIIFLFFFFAKAKDPTTTSGFANLPTPKSTKILWENSSAQQTQNCLFWTFVSFSRLEQQQQCFYCFHVLYCRDKYTSIFLHFSYISIGI